MRLLNVRIAPDDERLVKQLREQGVSISDVVRKAIRDEAQRRAGGTRGHRADLLGEMLTRFPTPSGAAPSPRIDSTDRLAVRRAIRRKLRSRA
jgi:hypothetical protein